MEAWPADAELGGHAVQADKEEVAPYVPAGQAEQESELMPEVYVPLWHVVQTGEGELMEQGTWTYVPAPHDAHWTVLMAEVAEPFT